MSTTPAPAPCRLVVVEGVAGTGKTTTAAALHERIEAAGVPSRLVLEGDVEHPADHEQVAVLDTDGWSALLGRHGAVAAASDVDGLLEPVPAAVLPATSPLGGRDDVVLVPYGRLRRDHPGLPDVLFADLAAHDVYEQPVDVWRALSLHRWRRFVAAAVGSPTTWVLDCCLLQNPLTVLLARHDVPVEVAADHVTEVAEVLRPLAPVVVHLDTDDVRATLDRVRPERPAGWWELFVGYHTEQAWGRHRGAQGIEGTVRFLEERTAVEHDLLAVLPVEHVCLRAQQDLDRLAGVHAPVGLGRLLER